LNSGSGQRGSTAHCPVWSRPGIDGDPPAVGAEAGGPGVSGNQPGGHRPLEAWP
jgi:hypothetical protein